MTFRAAYVLSDEGYSSGGRRQDTGDHVDHRALPGSIWADKGMDMTPLQPERYVLGRANAAEMLRYRIYVQQRMPRVAGRFKICCHDRLRTNRGSVPSATEQLLDQAGHAVRHE